MMSAELPFPVFEGGFTPWNHQCSLFQYPHDETLYFPYNIHEPVLSNSFGSYEQNEFDELIQSGLIVNEGNHKVLFQIPQELKSSFLSNDIIEPIISNLSGSEVVRNEPDDVNRTRSIMDEKKRKRKISNRESARRSRKKKQKLLEDLENQVNRHECLNRELTNRVNSVTHSFRLVKRENQMLESESGWLRQRLWVMRQVLLASKTEHMHFNNLSNELNNFN